ncbi:Cysteine sulfinate desulfinase/cysteine desulfurase [Pseudidiomarina maritima]|uniref:cysteine desulfurase n=1 Tax=Pseudidiomarina maritima TaxID=519453 RepID=A0A1I6GNU9_9GAMM|nr:aminotransferase class V-fold PLP-dependent enzyme [Pseudidiomarina maritima]SFR43870.1 Cysteine sulfinate desulfinase/cysteine desulfurase [Pseudidiomarina maritima]
MVTPVQIRPKSAEIYLDCNATTPVLPQIAQAVEHVMEHVFGNPSSSHITGLQARYILDNTRRLGRQVIGAPQGRLFFTSGATEGIQTAVLSALTAARNSTNLGGKRWLLYGATEHKAVPQALEHWNKLLQLNAELKAIPVDRRGKLDLQFIAEHVGAAHMICTMAVNNETGVKQDLVELERVIRGENADVPWMVDCVQALGKQNLALSETTIDYAPFSGHKLYGPKGIGFMYVRESAPFTPLIIGGGQEQGQRSGTENLPGIAALHALFELLLDKQQQVFQSQAVLDGYRDKLLTALRSAFPTLVLNHDLDDSVPTTLNFSVRGVPSRDIMDVFDAANIRVSSGSACSSGVTRSFVLDAMGLETWRSSSAIRLSFGPATSANIIDAACERIRDAAMALRQSCLLVSDTNEDIDSDLDGVVQLRFDSHCCYLLIDKAAGEMAVIDPVPELAERIERLVACQNYRVKAVLTTEAQESDSPAAMLAQLLCASGCSAQRDAVGWPLDAVGGCEAPVECQVDVFGCLRVGERRLYRVGTREPVFLLSSPLTSDAVSPHVDFAFIGEQHDVSSLAQVVHEQTLLLARRDDAFRVVEKLCEVSGDCTPCQLVDVSLEQQQEWLAQPETLVVDVREQQEHQVRQLSVDAEVINVPLTRLAQFIYSHRQHYKTRPIVCVCRSGHRSAVAAQVLARHGFAHVSHLSGGTALLIEADSCDKAVLTD